MRKGKQFLSTAAAGALILSMLLMVSCSVAGSDNEKTFVSIEKDGVIQSDIRESFEKSYYDEEELKQSILTQAATYNRNAGEGVITVEKVEVNKGTAHVKMTYGSADDYAAFNGVNFFAGHARDAEGQGLDINVVLSGIKDTKETVGKSDLLAMNEETLLITDITDEIRLNGKAVYVSENAVVSSNGKVICRAADSDKPVYIIFK